MFCCSSSFCTGIVSNVIEHDNNNFSILTITTATVPKINSAINQISQHKLRSYLATHCPNLLTEDVLNNQSFISGMRPYLDEFISFNDVLNSYQNTKVRQGRKTDLQQHLEKIKNKHDTLYEQLVNASKLSLDLSMGTSILCQRSANKLSILTVVVTIATEIAQQIKTTNAVPKMKKRIDQCKPIAQKTVEKISSYETLFKCYNSSLTWDKAFHDFENINQHKNISIDTILMYTTMIKENFFINEETISEANDTVKENIIDIIVQYFPVLQLTWTKCRILVDIREIILDSSIFDLLLNINEKHSETAPTEISISNNIEANAADKENPVFGPRDHAKNQVENHSG